MTNRRVFEACRSCCLEAYEADDEYSEWGKIVPAKKESQRNYVRADTFMQDGQVVLKEYKPTSEGIIQSWVARAL